MLTRTTMKLGLIVSLFATQLNALDNICEYGTVEKFSKIESKFYGKWKIGHMRGFVTVNSMTLPYKSSDDMDFIEIKREKVTFTQTDHKDGSYELSRKKDRLIGTHPKMQRPMIIEWANESAWSNNKNAEIIDKKLVLSDDDMSMVMGCELKDIPRLIGKTYVIVDGMKMNLTYRIMVVDENMMYVYMHAYGNMQGMQYDSWRTVNLTR